MLTSPTTRTTNLILKFLLELAALASFAIWGAATGSGATAVVIAIAAPLAVALLWGRLAAPRATRRLSPRARIPFELGVFALATGALITADHAAAAIVFAAVAAINAIGLTVFDQWEGAEGPPGH